MNVLLIDNYDSFTYNLYQYLCELGATVDVVRNDQITVAEVAARQPDRIVISPGPCTPAEAGISVDVIRELGSSIPILGVCLGHQAIGAAYGGAVVRAP
ncbi:MAG: anthranilate/aminodeoxychorismate synthase component II, partial [Chloroflexi bacterium]